MRETTGVKSRVSIRLKAAAGALLALLAVGAISTSSAQASTPGGEFGAEFNYVGLNVGISIAPPGLDDLVLTPDTPDETNPPAMLPPLELHGTYDNATGDFTLPKDGGLVFPPISVDLDIVQIDGEIGLAEAAHGNYDPLSGAMTLSPKISLILGTDHMENLPAPANNIGTGPLSCEFSPLDVDLSTTGGWPHPGNSFDPGETPLNGALAGAWIVKPKVKVIEGPKSACSLIAGFLETVGGLWMANDDTVPHLTEMPPATALRPAPLACPEGTNGTQPDCKTVVEDCPEGQTGTPPACEDIVEPKPYKVSKVRVTPKKGKIKAGKRLKLKIKVTNSGDKAGTTKVSIKSSNGKVTVPKTIKIKVGPRKSATRTIKVKASKKARGKANIKVKAAGKSATAKLTVKAAKKKKKKK